MDGKRRRRKFRRATRTEAEDALAQWFADNPRQGPNYDSRDRHMQRARAIATHTEAEWWAKVRRHKNHCHYCRYHCGTQLQKDHMTPVSRGGSDGIDNVVPACKRCNQAKSALTAEEFIAWGEATGLFDQPPPPRGPQRVPSIVMRCAPALTEGAQA